MVRRVVIAVLVLLGPLTIGPASGAESLEGTYRCASYNVSGGGGSCRTIPPLVLQPDGTYQYSSTRGSWRVQDGRLHLSEAKLWGPGEIMGPDTLRFEYEYRGWRHTVTWVCEKCSRRAAPRPGLTNQSGGSFIGVSLTLEFEGPVNGMSSFVIVPAEAAPQYTHNAPLPDGAVQGVAWNTRATAVGLATGRNKLRAGRQYVVFLSWPRESIPVAVLDLPAVTEDYATTLRATLGGTRSSSPAATPAQSSTTTGPHPATTSPSPAGASGGSQPAAPRCHPLIPKYSQPGCVE